MNNYGSSSQDSNPFGDPSQNGNHQLATAQRQVNEVMDVMRTNVNKVVEREGHLNELDQRAASLEENSLTFQTSSKRLRKKYWWENLKMKLILGGVVVTIIVVIIIVIVVESSGGGGGNHGTTAPPLTTTTTAKN